MFGLWRKHTGAELVEALHTSIVEASRRPVLYSEGGVPDTMEGRFEALTLHALVVLRRLRQLPAPADDVAQELVDSVFAHLEIALREMGIGDFGVPKRMKKLARAFYDRTSKYDPLLDRGDPDALALEFAARAGAPPDTVTGFVRMIIASEANLAQADLAHLLAGPPFAQLPQTASASLMEVQE